MDKPAGETFAGLCALSYTVLLGTGVGKQVKGEGGVRRGGQKERV